MSNWSLTAPLLPRLESAIQHRVDTGKLWRLQIPSEDNPGRMRTVTAAEMRALFQSLLGDAERRGANDRDTAAWLHQLLGWLEPPACEMDHCNHAGGVGSFCRCALGRVPGRCTIRRDYRRRRAARTERARARVLAVLAERETWINAEDVRKAIGCDPENLRIWDLLRGLADDGLAAARGDISRWPSPEYRITDAGRAAAADTAATCGEGPRRQGRRGEARAPR